MWIKRIVIDEKTQAKQVDQNKIQLDLLAYPLNEGNQKEPDAEFKLYVNNQLLQNISSDLQWNIKESLVINSNSKEITIKLQDISSWTVSNITNIFLSWSVSWNNFQTSQNQVIDNSSEKQILIAKLKMNPYFISQLPQRARDDKEIVKYALEQNWSLLQYVGENCKNDKELVLLALTKWYLQTYKYANLNNFKYISEVLQTDENFALECIEKIGIQITNQFSNYVKNLPKIKKEIDLIKDKIYKRNDILRQISIISNKLNRIKEIDEMESKYCNNGNVLADHIQKEKKQILLELDGANLNTIKILEKNIEIMNEGIEHINNYYQTWWNWFFWFK